MVEIKIVITDEELQQHPLEKILKIKYLIATEKVKQELDKDKQDG